MESKTRRLYRKQTQKISLNEKITSTNPWVKFNRILDKKKSKLYKSQTGYHERCSIVATGIKLKNMDKTRLDMQ